MRTHTISIVVTLVALAPVVLADDEQPAEAPVTTPGEVIFIEGSPPPPKVKAKPKKRYLPEGEINNIFLRPAPPYSDKAMLSDHWTVAWMLLDVDEAGTVTRVKFLKYPGQDLEKIAVKTALKLQFDPAIGDDGRPVRSYVAFPIEWPSYWWLISRTGLATGIPDTSHIPCRGSGPINIGSFHPAYKDCSRPTWSMANTEPWLAAPSDLK